MQQRNSMRNVYVSNIALTLPRPIAITDLATSQVINTKLKLLMIYVDVFG